MADLIKIKNLKVDVMSARGVVHAVRDINITIGEGEIHGIVGESGCGKTMTAKSILRLHDERKTAYGGTIEYQGKNIFDMSKSEVLHMRGGEIAMIFQDPAVTLNPIVTVGKQMTEMIELHLKLDKTEAKTLALKLLESVSIFPAEKRFDQYPFELSGGMLQRICIAMAISCQPHLLIADEPTTALDVTMQAQVLKILKGFKTEDGMSVLVITHNFGIIAEICDRVSVMYAGKIVETGDVLSIFKQPRHPYTQDLINSIPKADYDEDKHLITIPGSPPDLRSTIKGCPYAPRCKKVQDRCCMEEPILRTNEGEPSHQFACHFDFNCGKGAAEE